MIHHHSRRTLPVASTDRAMGCCRPGGLIGFVRVPHEVIFTGEGDRAMDDRRAIKTLLRV